MKIDRPPMLGSEHGGEKISVSEDFRTKHETSY